MLILFHLQHYATIDFVINGYYHLGEEGLGLSILIRELNSSQLLTDSMRVAHSYPTPLAASTSSLIP